MLYAPCIATEEDLSIEVETFGYCVLLNKVFGTVLTLRLRDICVPIATQAYIHMYECIHVPMSCALSEIGRRSTCTYL